MEAMEQRLSSAAYFELEAASETKHEYHHGEIFDMTGASARHNLIASNLITLLNNALGKTSCFVFPGDIKVEVDPGAHYTYPDVSVVCGEVAFAGGRDDVIVNPVVIVEVLSRSTADYDRGSKFKAYRKLAGLRDYLLVDQYRVSVEHFSTDGGGTWSLAEYEDRSDRVTISSVGVDLSLAEIYHRIDIEDEKGRVRRPDPS